MRGAGYLDANEDAVVEGVRQFVGREPHFRVHEQLCSHQIPYGVVLLRDVECAAVRHLLARRVAHLLFILLDEPARLSEEQKTQRERRVCERGAGIRAQRFPEPERAQHARNTGVAGNEFPTSPARSRTP